MKKGISPLIAAVLLIAFTMAVAGILATWATQFVKTESEAAVEEQKCVGSLALDVPQFSNGNVSVTLSNLNGELNLSGLKAFLKYNDVSKNKQYPLNATLGPTEKKTVTFSTDQLGTKPEQIEVVSKQCPKYPVRMNFR